MTAAGPALGAGVTWRIFGTTPGPDGTLPLVGQPTGGEVYVKLDPGSYYVHAAFGFAGSVQKINVTGPTGGQVVVLDAGALKLVAQNGGNQPITSDVLFDIYAADDNGATSQTPLVTTAPGKVVGLTAGFYHIVSRYGSANATATADVQIDAGKLTEATVFQQAARLTLETGPEPRRRGACRYRLVGDQLRRTDGAGQQRRRVSVGDPRRRRLHGDRQARRQHLHPDVHRPGRPGSRRRGTPPVALGPGGPEPGGLRPPAPSQPPCAERPAGPPPARSAAIAATSVSERWSPCSPMRRMLTVPSSASRRPHTRITGTFCSECSRTL